MTVRGVFKRGTMLIPSGPSHDPERKHLFIICTDPDANGQQLIVSITSKTNAPYDKTCLLQKHEHDFLDRESYVFYRKAKIVEHSSLINGVDKKIFIPKDDMNSQTFLRIRNGVCKSPQTPRGIKKYFGCDV